MTTTVRNFDGAETGGLDQLRGSGGSVSVEGSPGSPSANARSGDCNYLFDGGSSEGELDFMAHMVNGLKNDSVTDTFLHVGAALRPTDKTPASQQILCELEDGGGIVFATLRVETGANLAVYDAGGSVVTDGTITDPFTDGAYLMVDWFCEHAASGAWELFLDGVSVASGSGEDFFDVDGAVQQVNFLAGSVSGEDWRLDDFYFLTDDVAQPTMLTNASGVIQVFGYQTDSASQQGDALTDNDSFLGGGQSFANMGRTPLSTSEFGQFAGDPSDGAIKYNNSANANGHDGGPSTGAPHDVSGTIHAALWVYNLYRGNGGSGGIQEIWYGNSVDGPNGGLLTQSGNMETLASGSGGSTRQWISADADIVPLASEDFAQGFGTTQSRDIFCNDMWSMILHTPAVVSDDENRYGRPFGQRGQQHMNQLLAS